MTDERCRMKNSKIEWTTHTFNPWIGCQEVSPGCGGGDHGAPCYAKTMMDTRYRKVQWGPVNAGEKMHQRAGVKLHHGWMPNAPTRGLLLRDKQDEKRIASPANVPETSSVA